ncbi:MAG: hypothetical protein AAGB13_06770 [Cyanobacteria bacterium P01_F01_bin.33]
MLRFGGVGEDLESRYNIKAVAVRLSCHGLLSLRGFLGRLWCLPAQAELQTTTYLLER